MDFYQILSRYYDLIFPAKTTQYNFLTKDLEDQAQILDVGCGTGTYSIPLARSGYHLTAIDLDEEMMRQLSEKVEGENLNIRLLTLNMLHLNQLESNKYDLIFCIGNTLAHLENLNQVEQFILESHRLLKKSGRLVLQLVNFDRMVAEQIEDLPLLKNEDVGVTFKRTYTYGLEHVIFKGELQLRDGTTYEATQKLLPIGKMALETCFKIAEFSELKMYGSFEREPLTEHAGAIVAVACK